MRFIRVIFSAGVSSFDWLIVWLIVNWCLFSYIYIMFQFKILIFIWFLCFPRRNWRRKNFTVPWRRISFLKSCRAKRTAPSPCPSRQKSTTTIASTSWSRAWCVPWRWNIMKKDCIVSRPASLHQRPLRMCGVCYATIGGNLAGYRRAALWMIDWLIDWWHRCDIRFKTILIHAFLSIFWLIKCTECIF